MKGLLLSFIVVVFFLLFGVNSAYAQASCTTPAQVPNVEVEFPACDASGNCNFTEASCTWGQVSGAANYQVTVIQVESGASAYNQQVPSTTTTVSFPITQNTTYSCSVSAINSCGQAGPAGTHSLLCAADAAVTISPTVASSAPPPAVPAAGSLTSILTAGVVGIFLIAGLAFFLI